jgi:DNA-binding NarL/FixJ family response regulator
MEPVFYGTLTEKGFQAEGTLVLLTLRQSEVLKELIQGRSNQQIASNLGISEQTVKNYMTELLQFSDSESRTQLVSRMLNGKIKIAISPYRHRNKREGLLTAGVGVV